MVVLLVNLILRRCHEPTFFTEPLTLTFPLDNDTTKASGSYTSNHTRFGVPITQSVWYS